MTANTLGKFLTFVACVLSLINTAALAARPYADGDVLVGFRATGGLGAETSYLVNVGAATQFTNAAGTLAVSLGDTALADLAAIYGSDWHSRGDVHWSISGAQTGAGSFPFNTIFASRAATAPGVKSPSWNRATNATQLTPAGKISAMATTYAQGNATAGQVESGTLGLRQPMTTLNSYNSNMPGGPRLSSFDFYQSDMLGVENTFVAGTTNSVLDFYKMEPRPVGATQPGVLIGAFRLSRTAELTFSTTIASFAVPLIAFSQATTSVNEDVASGKITLTMNRTGVTNTALTARFSTVNGTAIAGTDFVGRTAVAVVFGVNEISKTLDVSIVDVPGFSGDRKFMGALTVASDDGFAASPREVEITIVDNDTPPSTIAFTAAEFSVGEDGVNAALTLSRQGFTGGAATVLLSTSNGTALQGTDFTGEPNKLITFAIGETEKGVNIAVVNRAGFAGNRQFSVALAGPTDGALLGAQASAMVTILERDPQPAVFTFSAGDYAVADGDGGVLITVVRTGATVPASIGVSTSNFTAIAGTDFVAQQNARLEFAQDELSKTVNVAIINRPGFSAARQFGVELSAPTGVGQIGPPDRALVTITDSTPNPVGRFVFESPTYLFATRTPAGMPNVATAVIVREVGQVGSASVQVALILGGFPAAGVSFASPAIVTFEPGERTKEIAVPLTAAATPGMFSLSLSNATGGSSIGAQSTTEISLAVADKKLPVVKLTSPKAGNVAAAFNVAGGVTEADPLDRVEVWLNGEKRIATLDGKSFTLGLTAENGPNTITAIAFDVKGTASLPVTVIVSFLDPAVAVNAGSYSALISPTNVAPPGGKMHNASGFISLAATTTGAFTGKVLIGGASLSVKGVLARNGDARFAGSETLRKGTIVFGKLALNIADGDLRGTLGATATVAGARAFYDGKTNVVSPQLLLANKGKFTAVFPAKTQSELPNDQFPQGDGIGFLTLIAKGVAKLTGTLADGTKFAARGSLSQQNKALFYALRYGKKGSFAGAVTFDTAAANSDFSGTDFLWLRPAQTAGTHYLAGWPSGVKVDALGAKYVIPAKAENRSVFPYASATMTFSEGNLADVVERAVSISSVNVTTANSTSHALTITPTSGALSGYFPHADGSKTKFRGVIFQKGPTRGGYGFFLSNVPKDAVAGQGGGVTIGNDE